MNAITKEKSLTAELKRQGWDAIDWVNFTLQEPTNQQDSSGEFEPAGADAESAEPDSFAVDGDRPLENEPEIPEPEPISDEAMAMARELFGFQSVVDYTKRPPSKFLVDGLLIEDQPYLIAAPEKCLKTTLSIDLAVSLASGTPFLGYFGVPERVRVCVMTGESGPDTVNETISRICKAKGIDQSSLADSLIITQEIPLLYEKDSVDKLLECVGLLKPRVLILDPLYLMMKGDQAGNLYVMGDQLKPLKGLSKLGCTPVVNHHTNASAGEPSGKSIELRQAAYAGPQQFFRGWSLLNRRKRYQEGTGHHEINFAFGGASGQSGKLKVVLDEGPNSAVEGRDYRLTVERLNGESATSDESKQSKQADRSERKYEKLKQVLKDYPSGLSQSRIAAALNINPQAAKTLLEAAKRDGVVGSRDGKSGNQDCVLYSLVQEPF